MATRTLEMGFIYLRLLGPSVLQPFADQLKDRSGRLGQDESRIPCLHSHTDPGFGRRRSDCRPARRDVPPQVAGLPRGLVHPEVRS
jgi:hypothetical protein